jgi:hypothetical protein
MNARMQQAFDLTMRFAMLTGACDALKNATAHLVSCRRDRESVRRALALLELERIALREQCREAGVEVSE